MSCCIIHVFRLASGIQPYAADSHAVPCEVASEDLEAVVNAYCEELHLPKTWKLLEVLHEGLMAGSGIKEILFSGGDLVIKREIPKGSPTFHWVEGLFENTFLKRYTRDRKGEKVPESLKVEEVDQVALRIGHFPPTCIKLP